jgi:GAF domain-containing protein
MAGDRRLRILAKLAAATDPESESKRLCEVSADVTEMTGAGIMLMSGDLQQGSVCSSNEVSALVERLQFEMGEGPSVDAYRDDQPILEADLAGPRVLRWPAFRPPAVAAGVRAIFGFPIRVGAVRLGALNLYGTRPGPLTDDQHADALVLAGVAAQAVLVMQAGAVPGQLAAALEASGDFLYVVHQAAGMVAAQLDVSVVQALIRLRAYAFSNDRAIGAVARDVVDRRLRFDD